MRKYPGTLDFETIKNRIVPTYAQSDTGEVRIVYPNYGDGQADIKFNRHDTVRRVQNNVMSVLWQPQFAFRSTTAV
jgi:hypothetical protein